MIRIGRMASGIVGALVTLICVLALAAPAQAETSGAGGKENGKEIVNTDVGTQSWFLATVGGNGANLRNCANTACGLTGSVPAWTNVRIVCQIRSQTVTGYYGTSNIWDYVVWEGTGYEGFAADANIYTGYDWIPGIDTCR